MAHNFGEDYYRDIEDRLRALRGLIGICIPLELGSFTEYLDAGEYGLAVEVATEALLEQVDTRDRRTLATGLLAEAAVMGLPDDMLVTLNKLLRVTGKPS